MRTFPAILLPLLLLGACRPADILIRETPIKVTEQRKGYGEEREGDYVTIDYRIEMPDGQKVMSHEDYGFQVGSDSVIRGIDEAVVGMRIGGYRRFTCPPHKHWGRAGYGNGKIPAATDLLIEMELKSIRGRTLRRIGSAETE